MKKKRLIATCLVAALSCVTLLGGCGSKEKTTSKEKDSGDQIELSFTWWGNDTRAEYTQRLLDMYTKEHPNIKFVANPVSWDGYWDKLATQAAGGNAPDLIQMDYSYISTYSKNGSLADLQKFVDDGTINVANMSESLLNAGKINGKLTGITISTSTATYAYNPDVLEEAGLSAPTVDWTWEDFADMCNTVKEKTGKLGMGSYTSDMWQYQQWVRENNASLYNKDQTALGYEDDSITSEWFQYWKDLVDSGAMISPDQWTIELTKPDDARVCPRGDAAFINASSTIGVVCAATNDHMGLMTLPLKEDGNKKAAWMKPGMFLSISSSASEEKQKAAAEFINWFMNSEDAGAVIGTDRGIPVSSNVRDALKSGKIGELTKQQKDMFDYADLAQTVSGECPPPDPQGATEVIKIYQDCLNKVLYGQKSAEDSAKEFREKANAVLIKNK